LNGKKPPSNNEIALVRKPLVDIVIPVYSQYKVLESCVRRLAGACQKYNWRGIIVDDASPDYETAGKEFYRTLPDNFHVIHHKENKGFAATVNDGIIYGKAPFIVSISSDVFMHDHSLDILIGQLEANPDIAVTSPKLLFPPNLSDAARPAGKIQHAGLVFDIAGRPQHIFMGWDDLHPFANRVKDYNAVTGACMVIKREVLNKVGLFDLQYNRGYFEDVDLCLRIRQAGFKIRYLPQAVGYHLVGASMALTNGNPNFERNWQYFKLKFGSNVVFDEVLFCGA
jgi:GT2 family glycosyltransferase